MSGHLKSYLFFLAFYVVTKAVVAPVINKMNLPVVGNSL